jgi:Tol biopolymer transport system component/DNA-binding winged helix-turn-helix (wHTH) protein
MTCFEFDSFQFVQKERTLKREGREIALAAKTADLLLLFLENPGTLFSNRELKERVWPGIAVAESSIHFQLSTLRRALGKRPDGSGYIENLPKKGFRFVAPVQRRTAVRSEPGLLSDSISPAGEGVALPTEADKVPAVPLPVRRWLNRAIGAGLVLAICIVLLGYRMGPPPPLSVARYIPLTGDGREKDRRLFTDGARIYFIEKRLNATALASVPVRGGEPTFVALPAGFDGAYDLLPGASAVLAGRLVPGVPGRELWLVPLLAGAPTRLGALRANDAKFSPNGKRIALTVGEDLSIANADGSGLRRIVHLDGSMHSPRWSPDGKRIRFTFVEYDTLWSSLWEVRTDGSDLHELLTGWHNPPGECCGVWTPDGRSYIFQSTRNGRNDLWVLSERQALLNPEARSPTRLTSGLQGYATPIVSGDGRQVFGIGTENRGELVRYDPRSKELVRMLGGIPATWVNFSSSGRSVVYIRYPDSTVWRSNLDGSESVQITFLPFEADGLAWSPDERWLAMRGRTPGEPWKIYLVPSGGGMPESIVPGEKEQGVPSWSADGGRIAFGDVPAVFAQASGTERIHILNLRDRSLSDLPGSRGLWTARWSPDGRYLLALTIQGQRLMLYDFQTAKWRSIGADSVNNPTWSRDQKFVYYDTLGSGRALCRISLIGGHVDRLFSLETFPTLSWWWSGVTPDNAPLILRNLGTTEIYALALDSR